MSQVTSDATKGRKAEKKQEVVGSTQNRKQRLDSLLYWSL